MNSTPSKKLSLYPNFVYKYLFIIITFESQPRYALVEFKSLCMYSSSRQVLFERGNYFLNILAFFFY